MKFTRFALTLAAAGLALAFGSAAAVAAEAASTTSLNVRSGPGPGYRVVDVLRAGERVDIQRCVGSWCYITHPGPDGWVSANYLSRGGGSRWDDRWNHRPPVHVRPPYYSHYPRYRPHYNPYSSFCLGNRNASFCFGS
jgi:hypothetical protein